MSWPRRIVITLVLAAGATAVAFQLPSGDESEERGPLLLLLYGNIEIRDAQLAFREQELVAEVLVEEGARVEVGDVLARLRGDRLAAELAAAGAARDAASAVLRRLRNGTREQEIAQVRAEFAAAKVRVENARRDLERIRRTTDTGASSQLELDAARAAADVAEAELAVREEALALALEGPRSEDIAAAEADLAEREARVRLLELRRRDLELVAPQAGIIRSRILEPGETALPGRPAFTLALTDRKWVRAYVPEPELGHVVPGQPATVLSDTWPDREFSGHVGFVSPEAEFTPKTVETTELRTSLVYEVRIRLDDPGDELRLGMPVTVHLQRRDGAERPR